MNSHVIFTGSGNSGDLFHEPGEDDVAESAASCVERNEVGDENQTILDRCVGSISSKHSGSETSKRETVAAMAPTTHGDVFKQFIPHLAL